jgi:hypothetical protein
MINSNDAAVAGIAFLVFALVLIVIGIVIASRRWTIERRELRRGLNQAHVAMDTALGIDLETTRQLVWSHRKRPASKHRARA